jgi:hypothetical protein
MMKSKVVTKCRVDGEQKYQCIICRENEGKVMETETRAKMLLHLTANHSSEQIHMYARSKQLN